LQDKLRRLAECEDQFTQRRKELEARASSNQRSQSLSAKPSRSSSARQLNGRNTVGAPVKEKGSLRTVPNSASEQNLSLGSRASTSARQTAFFGQSGSNRGSQDVSGTGSNISTEMIQMLAQHKNSSVGQALEELIKEKGSLSNEGILEALSRQSKLPSGQHSESPEEEDQRDEDKERDEDDEDEDVEVAEAASGSVSSSSHSVADKPNELDMKAVESVVITSTATSSPVAEQTRHDGTDLSMDKPIDHPSALTAQPQLSADRRDSVTHVYDDLDWGLLQAQGSDCTPRGSLTRGALNRGEQSRATAVVTDFTKQELAHHLSTGSSSASRANPTTERRTSGNAPRVGPRGSGSCSASAGTGSAGSSRPGSALGSSRQPRNRGVGSTKRQSSPATASASEASAFPSSVPAGVRQKSATAKGGGREKASARGLSRLPLGSLNAKRDAAASQNRVDDSGQTTADEAMKTPIPQAPLGLASELSEFAPPPAPTFAAISAALLAETREELDMLAKAADCAATTCLASAPLAEALRTAVMRELAQLEAKQATMSLQADPFEEAALRQRISELRASAAQGLELLRGALKNSPAFQAEAQSPCTTTSLPPSTSPASMANLQVPAQAFTSLSGFRSPDFPPVLHGAHPMPAAPRAASPLPRACTRPWNDAIVPGTPPHGVVQSCVDTPPPGATAALQGSASTNSLSPPFALALGCVVADMRQALSEIRLARRMQPREPRVASPLGGRSGGLARCGSGGLSRCGSGLPSDGFGLRRPLPPALWQGSGF